MCGICGEVRLDDAPADAVAVQKMANRMFNRGPDADGLVCRKNVAFAHRRLKIIDLSESSQQPMIDSQLGLTIVFNGAIYNYPELRKELEGLGYQFFSHGDTEVILKAYAQWGEDCVLRLNGMFAFAIHHRDSGRVFLARDRLGIKPLYYTRSAKRFRFASTLPALLAGGDVDRSIDHESLNYYLSFHSIVPAPRTMLTGVKKLPPATTATIDTDGSFQMRSYWHVKFGTIAAQEKYSENDWIEATLDVMRRAVKRRMIADVPVGVLLSGGLDSSLIVGLLHEQGATGIETFSIGFDTVGDEVGDEFVYSDIVAKRFQTSHHQLRIDSGRTLPALADCIAEMSEPMVSHDNVGFYLLSQEVAKFVKVVQSGQGADEIFAGYHWYPPMVDSKNALATYREQFFDRDYAEYCDVVAKEYRTSDHASRFVEAHFATPGATEPIDQALRIDTQVMLVDDPVKRVDNHTMAASLEARVPFLDHEVVEFAATVPAHLKLADDGKYILKEAARRVIPAEVIDRAKGYFPVPALKYLRGDFLKFAADALTGPSAASRGLFNTKYVNRLLADPESHITPLMGSKLWQLALLERWLQCHVDS